ncbi:MAG: hydroxymethylbilane synthase [Actinomycetota bacterium]
MPLRIATRGSELARWQAEHVGKLLAGRAGVGHELVIVSTTGDQRLDVPIGELSGTGIFVKEVQAAVLDGRADLAVHSAKDLPSSFDTPGLTLASVPERGDPRDALVGSTLDRLPEGATVATGSARRQAQLAHLRPDLRFVGLRGNLATRVDCVRQDGIDVVPVALVAMRRLGMEQHVAEVLDPERCVPQVGQGALAVECRTDDPATLEQLAAIEDVEARRLVDAERSYLATLGGGCDLPVGAVASAAPDGGIRLLGVLAAPDGSRVLRDEVVGDDPSIGAMLAHRLLDDGGRELLGTR